jgi:hypothetical protein
MRTDCTFTVEEFTPDDWVPEIETALGVGHAHMVKRFAGGLAGRSVTQFSYAFDNDSGVGSYVATESFEGTVDGHGGTFNLIHSATTLGHGERLHELFVVVPGSGTGGLAGIGGTGSLTIDADGTHRISLDYTLDHD